MLKYAETRGRGSAPLRPDPWFYPKLATEITSFSSTEITSFHQNHFHNWSQVNNIPSQQDFNKNQFKYIAAVLSCPELAFHKWKFPEAPRGGPGHSKNQRRQIKSTLDFAASIVA